MRNLITTPAAGRSRQKLEHLVRKFVPFSSSFPKLANFNLLGEIISNELNYATEENTDMIFGFNSDDNSLVKDLSAYVSKCFFRNPSDAEKIVPSVEEKKKYNVIYHVVEEKEGNTSFHEMMHETDSLLVVVVPEEREFPGLSSAKDKELLAFITNYSIESQKVFLYRRNWRVTSGGGDQQKKVQMINKWNEYDAAIPQCFYGPGAGGFLKSLSLERDTRKLCALVMDFSSVSNVAELQQVVTKCPMRFLANNGQEEFGTWVSVLNENQEEDKKVEEDGNFSLTIEKPGDLSTIRWITAPNGPEYDTNVLYSSLNFKDVMYSFGKLRLKKPSFGLEFAGFDRKTGEKMMGIGISSCIAKRTKSALRWKIPEYLTMEEAGTMPVVYLTSAYALFEKANLQKGDSVLIHAGTGGIGHSAIHLCQERGIKVNKRIRLVRIGRNSSKLNSTIVLSIILK